jgi:aryl-alcohol dehydrogenase-like predicted oxidoreductase
VGQLQRLHEQSRIASVQVPYNLLCRDIENGLLAYAGQQRITVLAHSSLARGYLAGAGTSGRTFAGDDTRRDSAYFSDAGQDEKQRLLDTLRDLAAAANLAPATVAIQWVLRDPRVSSALVGIKSERQLAEAVLAVEVSISTAAHERLASVSSRCGGVMTGNLARRETRDASPAYERRAESRSVRCGDI